MVSRQPSGRILSRHYMLPNTGYLRWKSVTYSSGGLDPWCTLPKEVIVINTGRSTECRRKRKTDRQCLKSLRIHVSDNGWPSEGSETDGHVGSNAFCILHFWLLKRKLRKLLCTCIQRETMVRALRMEIRLTQVQQYTVVSVALELQKDLEVSLVLL